MASDSDQGKKAADADAERPRVRKVKTRHTSSKSKSGVRKTKSMSAGESSKVDPVGRSVLLRKLVSLSKEQQQNQLTQTTLEIEQPEHRPAPAIPPSIPDKEGDEKSTEADLQGMLSRVLQWSAPEEDAVEKSDSEHVYDVLKPHETTFADVDGDEGPSAEIRAPFSPAESSGSATERGSSTHRHSIPETPVNFFEAEAGRLKDVKQTVAEIRREQDAANPPVRDILDAEKPNLLRRLVSSNIKHLDPEVREEKMKASVKASALENLTPPANPKHESKILVVEDNKAIQKVMQSLLYKLNYHNIFVANNGQEGVDMFFQHRPDIIFMDLYMPLMDGIQATEAIRSSPEGVNVPIVAVTAHDGKDDVGRSLDNGMNGVLQKPIGVKQLKRVLNRFTGEGAGKAVFTKRDFVALATSKKPPPEKARVLVAEDNKMIQVVMKKLLVSLKYTDITICNDGRAAVDAMAILPYDIIFMDLYMPEMDGVEATAEIRKLPHGRNIPIIACTAHAIESDTKLCVEYGMNDLLLKPVQTKALVTVFQKFGFQATMPKKKKMLKTGSSSKMSKKLPARESSLASMTAVERQRATTNSDVFHFSGSTPGLYNRPSDPMMQSGSRQFRTSNPVLLSDGSAVSSGSSIGLKRNEAVSESMFPMYGNHSGAGSRNDSEVNLVGTRILQTDQEQQATGDMAMQIVFSRSSTNLTEQARRELFRRQSSLFGEGLRRQMATSEMSLPVLDRSLLPPDTSTDDLSMWANAPDDSRDSPETSPKLEMVSLDELLSMSTDLTDKQKLKVIWDEYLIQPSDAESDCD